MDEHLSECDWMLQFTIKGLDENGREVMWNIRGRTVAEFDANMNAKGKNINKLKPLFVASQRGASAPVAAAAQGQGTNGDSQETGAAPECQIHHTPMAKRQGRNGQSFWSCPRKLDDGSWCPYRPKQG